MRNMAILPLALALLPTSAPGQVYVGFGWGLLGGQAGLYQTFTVHNSNEWGAWVAAFDWSYMQELNRSRGPRCVQLHGIDKCTMFDRKTGWDLAAGLTVRAWKVNRLGVAVHWDTQGNRWIPAVRYSTRGQMREGDQVFTFSVDVGMRPNDLLAARFLVGFRI